MDFIAEANLEYETELKRTPTIPQLWLGYIEDSRSCSCEV